MRKVIALEHISLDGVIQAPGGMASLSLIKSAQAQSQQEVYEYAS